MQRGLGDRVGGGSEGQEDGGPMGFQSVVQDGNYLISWDGDLSAGVHQVAYHRAPRASTTCQGQVVQSSTR